MISPLFPCLLALVAAPFEADTAYELRYTGTLTKLARDAESEPVKRFSVYGLVMPASEGAYQIGFVVDERGGNGWPWMERFGVIEVDAKQQPTSPVLMRLLYDHEGNLNGIKLPRPLFEHASRVKAGATWNTDEESFETAGQTAKVGTQNREAWSVNVSTNFGRKRTLWIEKDSPLIVALEERVFMGQGVEFSLKMQLEDVQALTAEQLAKHRQPLELMRKLQADLQRKENETSPELTTEQLAIAAAAAGPIEQAAADTPFSRFATVIARDVKQQQQRTDEVVQLAKKYVGQTIEDVTLKLMDGKTSAPADRADKLTVLHFWEYQDDPLVEPYGQIGYLDYLFSRRRKLGVQVYGVAVDERLGDKSQASAALRSIGKLKAFMNLGYPIALDNGDLLAKFGDPRKVGAKLPLWVVLDADGKIVHYSVGFYKINPDEGLRQLDEVLVEEIKANREKE